MTNLHLGFGGLFIKNPVEMSLKVQNHKLQLCAYLLALVMKYAWQEP